MRNIFYMTSSLTERNTFFNTNDSKTNNTRQINSWD